MRASLTYMNRSNQKPRLIFLLTLSTLFFSVTFSFGEDDEYSPTGPKDCKLNAQLTGLECGSGGTTGHGLPPGNPSGPNKPNANCGCLEIILTPLSSIKRDNYYPPEQIQADVIDRYRKQGAEFIYRDGHVIIKLDSCKLFRQNLAGYPPQLRPPSPIDEPYHPKGCLMELWSVNEPYQGDILSSKEPREQLIKNPKDLLKHYEKTSCRKVYAYTDPYMLHQFETSAVAFSTSKPTSSEFSPEQLNPRQGTPSNPGLGGGGPGGNNAGLPKPGPCQPSPKWNPHGGTRGAGGVMGPLISNAVANQAEGVADGILGWRARNGNAGAAEMLEARAYHARIVGNLQQGLNADGSNPGFWKGVFKMLGSTCGP